MTRSISPSAQNAGRAGRLATLLCLLLTMASCGANIYSISDDAALGRQMDAQIRSNPSEFPILQNEPVRAYVQGIVDRIVATPTVKYRGTFPYKVTLLDDDRTVNAFATPGGFIYVYTGLLKFIDNEASLAGVLAHEVAHAEERHGTEHMTSALGADVALQIALGNNSSALTRVAANAGVLLAQLSNSRQDELEADLRSFDYLRGANYYPGSMKFFFEKMLQRGAQRPSVLESWTSTHPTSDDRIEQINRLLREQGVPPPTTAQLLTEPYRAALRKLR